MFVYSDVMYADLSYQLLADNVLTNDLSSSLVLTNDNKAMMSLMQFAFAASPVNIALELHRPQTIMAIIGSCT